VIAAATAAVGTQQQQSGYQHQYAAGMPPQPSAGTATMLPQDHYAQQQQQQQQQRAAQQQQQQSQPHYATGTGGTAAAPPFASYPPQHGYDYTQHHQPSIYHAQLQQQQAAQQQPHHVPYIQQQQVAVAAGAVAEPMHTHHHHAAATAPQPPIQPPQQQQQPYVQPTVGRLPADRPLVKLSVSLIDTYKQINKVYYEEREAKRARAKAKQPKGQGSNNNGWDDENHDYIITKGEMFYGRYVIEERIGKGSFGQVVRALDTETNKDVAIKIIKSRKPFLMQAKTEIDLLTHLRDRDPEDQHNIVRLETHFMYRNHQCLVFEMLSLNLYELLKNTQFGGVSLNLIRKFAKQILKALAFLRRPEVDIIHCDLKPENILLRHPKRSGIKVIDFGSSCKSNKRMYSYIQSRFYRSPEVMLGLPYSVAIDMWSLGCILVEMHTGEPLFSGSDQFDQMQKIVKMLGMVPSQMLDESGDTQRNTFFERAKGVSGSEEWVIRQVNATSKSGSSAQPKQKIVPSDNPVESLTDVICAESNKKKRYPASETGNSPRNYELFVDLIYRMLAYLPEDRIKPDEALNHPFIRSGEASQTPRSSAPRKKPDVDMSTS